MAMTEAQTVFKQPNARAMTAVIMEPTDPSQDGATVRFAVADRPFWTLDTGPTPGISFKNLIADRSGVTFTESLTKPGLTIGESDLTAGRMVVDSDDEIAGRWPGLDWNGRPVTIYLGAERKAGGARMELDEFDTAFSGLIEEVRSIGDRQFEVTFADLRVAFDKEFSTKLYRGFGGAFPIRTHLGGGTRLFQAHSPSMDVTGELTLEWIGVVEAAVVQTPSAAVTPLVMNGDNGKTGDPGMTMNYGLMINDQLGFAELAFAGGIDGGGEAQLLSSGYLIPFNQPAVLAATVAADGQTVTFFAGEDGDNLDEVGSGVLDFPLAAGDPDGVRLGQQGGSSAVPWEVRVWDSLKTLEELKVLADGPVTDATARADLLESWRFSEAVELGLGPEFVFGEKGVLDLIPAGDPPTWETTYTGDDADVFAGSVAGKTHAITYGPALNVPLARVDSQRHIFGWDSEVTNDVTQLRDRMAPMVPEHTVVASAPGEFVFAGNPVNTITITNPAIGSFAPYIPGQRKPSRLGQRIEIENSINVENQGVFRVAIDGVSDDGLVLTVADRHLVNESGPGGTTVFSYGQTLGNGDIQYRKDLARSIVHLAEDPDGEITGDIVGRLPGSGLARWTELFEMISGVAPDTSNVTFDPVLGFHLHPGSGLTTNKILDELARSSFGWWTEDLVGGGYRLGSFAPPSGPPVEVLSGSEMFDIEPLKSFNPHWRFDIKYQKIWKIQNPDAAPSSVTQADKQKWSEPYTTEASTNRSVLESYPESTEHKGFETWVVEHSDALLFKALANAMLSTKRDWFKIRFASFFPWNIQLYDVINVTWDDETLGLAGVDCRVTARDVSTGDYTMTLEVHT